MLLTLDPAIGSSGATGVALFNGAQLAAAGVIRKPAALGDGIAAQCEVARLAVAWFHAWRDGVAGSSKFDGDDVLVAEWPQVYPGPRGRGKDPNRAILPLCGVVAHVSGMLPAYVQRVQYLPREWKGSIDGDAFTARIYGRLSPQELAIVNAVTPAGLRHNAADAVGLGLFHLGRLERRHVIHR